MLCHWCCLTCVQGGAWWLEWLARQSRTRRCAGGARPHALQAPARLHACMHAYTSMHKHGTLLQPLRAPVPPWSPAQGNAGSTCAPASQREWCSGCWAGACAELVCVCVLERGACVCVRGTHCCTQQRAHTRPSLVLPPPPCPAGRRLAWTCQRWVAVLSTLSPAAWARHTHGRTPTRTHAPTQANPCTCNPHPCRCRPSTTASWSGHWRRRR